ncbi:hypothetical protein C9417_25250 [Rhizobium sp. SEMIA 4088]|nr:hypothetical protein C9417_25250 [Rhizobium sp. SEMIA 4088]
MFERFSIDIMLYFFDSRADSDFRATDRNHLAWFTGIFSYEMVLTLSPSSGIHKNITGTLLIWSERHGRGCRGAGNAFCPA